MPSRAFLSWSKDLLNYDFGFGHPMSPIRLDLTMRLAQELGLLDGADITVASSGLVPDETLALVHSAEYIAAVHAASDDDTPDETRGLGTEDNPSFPGMHEASSRMVASTVDAAMAVWRGEAEHAINLAGGMHHAMPEGAAGFCIYNDAAVAIKLLQQAGARRVLYVDLDAHHGDGVERAFWNDPDVLTLSIHQSGATLFPGTGYPTDIGGPDAQGTAVNIAVPARTESGEWLRALHAVLPEVARAFQPDMIVSQHGCDAHSLDTLSDLRVSINAQRQGAALVHDLAHELCDGKWLALGGGGYSVVDVVPIMWTHVLSLVVHQEVECAVHTPPQWRQYIRQYLDHSPPETMGDDWGPTSYTDWGRGYDPQSDIDRAVRATRSAVFPHLGVDLSYEI